MTERDGGSRRHRLFAAALARLSGLVPRARRAGRCFPAPPERRSLRPAVAPGPAEPPSPEELEALVAAALGTPRPPAAPTPAPGTTKTPPAADACDPEPPSGPVDVGRRAAHDARTGREARVRTGREVRRTTLNRPGRSVAG
ncbi:hypothetical protein [Streptomyces aureocirculatus]|uniref:hypothetical protein n=1 Tax=Streptomyces aureocirculatus TaxID=67275 RepID=UPI0004CA02DE|nr:hypothetical protein [Streptomyces aureocirculatus]